MQFVRSEDVEKCKSYSTELGLGNGVEAEGEDGATADEERGEKEEEDTPCDAQRITVEIAHTEGAGSI